MQQINSTAGLKDAIQLLELERDYENQILKEHFQFVTTSFKPKNLLSSSLNGSVTSNLLIDNLIDSTIGSACGFITKKLIIGKSDNKFRVLLGSVFQLVVVSVVAKHHYAIESFGKLLLQSFIKKNKS
jgi:hypothetical protein